MAWKRWGEFGFFGPACPEGLMIGAPPQTPVKGGIALDNPGFAILADCERLDRQLSWIRQRPDGASFSKCKAGQRLLGSVSPFSRPMTEKNYKETLNLPKTAFPMKADLVKREPERLGGHLHL